MQGTALIRLCRRFSYLLSTDDGFTLLRAVVGYEKLYREVSTTVTGGDYSGAAAPVLAVLDTAFLPYKVLGNFSTSPLVTANVPPVFCPYGPLRKQHVRSHGLKNLL